MMRIFRYAVVWSILLSVFLTSCSQGAGPKAQDTAELTKPVLTILATTTLVGDVVQNVAGDRVIVQALVPPGVDEHTFQFTPADVARVANADAVFMNGAGLEAFMAPLLKNVGNSTKIFSVSDGIELLNPQAVGEGAGGDPHVWTDPNLVMIWTKNIASAMAELDPEHAEEYRANAERYQKSLQDLNLWIETQVAQVPPANRQLVTDHEMFTYFAQRYGFKQAGAVIPTYSTVAEPTAQGLAALEDAIRQLGVKAVFVGDTVNPSLASRVAQDTGAQLVKIYTGSLTENGPADTYLDYMRHNVAAIVGALK